MAGSSKPSVLVIAGVFILLASCVVDAQLMNNYYGKQCPKAETVVNDVVKSRVKGDRTLAPSLLRLHFHDCFVDGCDASVLIDSTPGNVAEKDAAPNANSLRGFDVIDEAKAAVESLCPGVVSCADIVALAARDAVAYIGGPSWDVPTGRRDGSRSSAASAAADLPSPQATFAGLKSAFSRVGLDAKDVVVLSGAHTIGRSHCKTISSRLYNFPGTKDGIDPTLNKPYALQLRKKCPPGSSALVNMDPSLGGETFDTNYYANLFNDAGLFHSDEALLTDGYSRGVIQNELNTEASFFNDFGNSMVKMGKIGVLTNVSPFTGDIRQNCHKLNQASASKVAKSSGKKGSAKKSSKKSSKKTSKKSSKKSSKKK